MVRRLTLGVVLSVAVSPSASAQASVEIQARMFRRDTRNLDDDLFKGSVVAKLGSGVAREMLVDVTIPEGVAGRHLRILVQQGELDVAQIWKIAAGRVVGSIAPQPLLVAPTFCREPMIITARIGALVETKIITFGD